MMETVEEQKPDIDKLITVEDLSIEILPIIYDIIRR